MERFTPRRIWSPSARSDDEARDIELAGELQADPAVEPALGGVRSCCWLLSWLLISTVAIAAGTVMPNCMWMNLAVASDIMVRGCAGFPSHTLILTRVGRGRVGRRGRGAVVPFPLAKK